MPTGYTCDVKDGKIVELSDFVMQCARAFGALVLMRDEPQNTPIPDEFQPSTFYLNCLANDEAELLRCESLTDDEWEHECDEAFRIESERYEKMNREADEAKERYNAMLEKVNRWSPPTTEHYKLKEFMVEQLHSSIEFDCHHYGPAKKYYVDTFRQKRLAQLHESIALDREELAKEQERTKSRNEWVRKLRESLSDKP